MNWFELEIQHVLKKKTMRTATVKGLKVYYIEPKVMKLNGSFGYLYNNEVYIRKGLPKRVERFVINHEVYHSSDTKHWWGWIGRELRANVMCGLKDPIGLISTIVHSLSKERIGAYLRSLKRVNFKQV